MLSWQYDGEVKHLRRALTEHGVAWSRGPQLKGMQIHDGWHYDAVCLDSVVGAVSAWLQEAQPIGDRWPLDERFGRHP